MFVFQWISKLNKFNKKILSKNEIQFSEKQRINSN